MSRISCRITTIGHENIAVVIKGYGERSIEARGEQGLISGTRIHTNDPINLANAAGNPVNNEEVVIVGIEDDADGFGKIRKAVSNGRLVSGYRVDQDDSAFASIRVTVGDQDIAFAKIGIYSIRTCFDWQTLRPGRIWSSAQRQKHHSKGTGNRDGCTTQQAGPATSSDTLLIFLHRRPPLVVQ